MTPEWVAELFRQSPEALASVLRAHLVPARQDDRRYTAQFRALWRSVAFLDRRERSRVLQVLQGWRDEALEALKIGADLDPDDLRTITFFCRDVEGAIDRVHREIKEPLSWASNEYAEYPLAARGVIEALALGIDEFNEGNLTQKELLALLDVHGLSPESIADLRETQVPVEARARVIKAAKQGHRPDFKR
ncbi:MULTISPECIES: hypothetical protein [Mycolicibacter]|uniref:Uncharacterized protein n=2 Tax=Mycolicibacter TaxID=1073531 RepID=A0ABU5XLC3_9MYCO|nr:MULTISPECIES: hypothetical protein [unclassified Mycolicibacter]MEB3022978.1 hypothetical protein [Mycolicibacter sp. MYC098]MEB3033488.1 hypothetical protein [Mycolicibacter sp. MYC340]